MADVYLNLTYKVDLSDKDMRLICLSLAGRLKKKDDLAAATELNLRLLESQKTRLNEKLTSITGAIQSATEPQGDGQPDHGGST